VTKHVLVVEDDAPTRSFLVAALTDQGYAVSAAVDGQSGLERCDEVRPDLVVLDLGLPVIDGIEFLKRRSPDCSGPVVAMSAAHRRSEVEGLPVTAFIAKPFDLYVFLRTIDECMDGMNEGHWSEAPTN
jgi:DNA-binding response OmpR family regulator